MGYELLLLTGSVARSLPILERFDPKILINLKTSIVTDLDKTQLRVRRNFIVYCPDFIIATNKQEVLIFKLMPH